MYLTVRQAAEKLQVCKKTIQRRIADGSIPAYRVSGQLIRIKEDDLNQYLENNKQGGNT